MISSRPHHRPLNRISQQARMKRWIRKAGAVLNETYRRALRDGDAAVVPAPVNITKEAVDLTEINLALESKMRDGNLILMP